MGNNRWVLLLEVSKHTLDFVICHTQNAECDNKRMLISQSNNPEQLTEFLKHLRCNYYLLCETCILILSQLMQDQFL